ncbi:hypothetical protein AOLI_G00028090 [Acnodon oligacanthus]
MQAILGNIAERSKANRGAQRHICPTPPDLERAEPSASPRRSDDFIRDPDRLTAANQTPHAAPRTRFPGFMYQQGTQ